MTIPSGGRIRPPCGRAACTADAVVQWSQRLAVDVVAALPVEQVHGDMRRQVYACADHAITLDLAARVHRADCSGPDSARLPDCDCTPESLPQPRAEREITTLPTGWQIPAAP